jgi:hypothetical protein
MAYQKLQVSSAIRVIPSDNVNIPNPSSPNVEGAIQAKGPNDQIQFTEDILEGTEFKRGAIIINTTAGIIGTIESVVAPGVAAVDNDFYTGSSNNDAIIIYADENEGCIIYMGNTANGASIHVETASGQQVVYENVPQGSFLPVQVVRVNAGLTTVEDLIANW